MIRQWGRCARTSEISNNLLIAETDHDSAEYYERERLADGERPEREEDAEQA